MTTSINTACSNRASMFVCGIALMTLVSVSCAPEVGREVDEKVPEISVSSDASLLAKYKDEFSQPLQSRAKVVQELPVAARLPITDVVQRVDYNPNCAVWLILSKPSGNPGKAQQLYLYSSRSNRLDRTDAFTGKDLRSAFLLSDRAGERQVILGVVENSESQSTRFQQLRTNDVRTGALALMAGSSRSWSVAPDHTKFAFLISDKAGFNSLHVLDLNTGEDQVVMSAWDRDPSSGTSWWYYWSVDSEALYISGTCGGYTKSKPILRVGSTKLNLLYIVADKALYSLETNPSPR